MCLDLGKFGERKADFSEWLQANKTGFSHLFLIHNAASLGDLTKFTADCTDIAELRAYFDVGDGWFERYFSSEACS